MNVPDFPHRRRGNFSGIPEKIIVAVGLHSADFGLGPKRSNNDSKYSRIFSGKRFLHRFYLVSHGSVAAPAFVPHAVELGLINLGVVVDTQILFVGMLPVQASGVLLQGSLPGNRHGQHQRSTIPAGGR